MDKQVPQWWLALWARNQIKYPSAVLDKHTATVYWEDLHVYPEPTLAKAFHLARLESPTFFPPCGLIETKCIKLQRQQRERERRAAEKASRIMDPRRQLGCYEAHRPENIRVASASAWLVRNEHLAALAQVGSEEDAIRIARSLGWQDPGETEH